MHSINTHRCSTVQRASRVSEGLQDRSERIRSNQQEGLQDRSEQIHSNQQESFSALVLRAQAYHKVQAQQQQKKWINTALSSISSLLGLKLSIENLTAYPSPESSHPLADFFSLRGRKEEEDRA